MTTPTLALPVLKNNLATDSALEAKVLQLLLDHGVNNSGSFFHTFQDPAAVKKLLQPTTVGEGVKLTQVDNRYGLEAGRRTVPGRNLRVRSHVVDEIRVARAARVAAAASTPAAATSSTAATATKVPKTLPDNYWADFLSEYQSETIGGIARQFPTHLLSGADEVLARLVHERVTRSFSPLRWER